MRKLDTPNDKCGVLFHLYFSWDVCFGEFTENYPKENLNVKPQTTLLMVENPTPDSDHLETAPGSMSEQPKETSGAKESPVSSACTRGSVGAESHGGESHCMAWHRQSGRARGTMVMLWQCWAGSWRGKILMGPFQLRMFCDCRTLLFSDSMERLKWSQHVLCSQLGSHTSHGGVSPGSHPLSPFRLNYRLLPMCSLAKQKYIEFT